MARLLIVDDDKANRKLLSVVMRRDGHQVTEAETGQDCLTLAQQSRQDIILLDAKMPGMDGFTCCAELKTILGHRCPPIIIITGLTDEKSVDQAFAVGAIDYVTKPIHMAVLRHRVQRVLYERELRHQLSITNQQLASINQELHHLTRIDSLTQIANRRYFDERLDQQWRHLARHQRLLGILLCDVDFFKQYNDLYGHLAGDRCLRDLSQVLKLSLLRSADLVARYGGEEFIILLPETDAAGTLEVAKRIHKQLSKAAIPHADSQVSPLITLSIGAICTIPNVGNDPYDYINLADQALYAAKAGGRNQTVLSPASLATSITASGPTF